MTLPITTILEERIAVDGKRYTVNTPVGHASETTFTTFVAEVLREYLYRQGANVERASDDEILRRVRHTFVNMPAPFRG